MRAAMLEIQRGNPFSSTPWALLTVNNGLFLNVPQRLSWPSSPHDKKYSSFMSFTESMLPSLPWNSSCDSSTIFQMRIDLSNPPLVIALSRDNASIDVMPLWWPKLKHDNSFLIVYFENTNKKKTNDFFESILNSKLTKFQRRPFHLNSKL